MIWTLCLQHFRIKTVSFAALIFTLFFASVFDGFWAQNWPCKSEVLAPLWHPFLANATWNVARATLHVFLSILGSNLVPIWTQAGGIGHHFVSFWTQAGTILGNFGSFGCHPQRRVQYLWCFTTPPPADCLTCYFPLWKVKGQVCREQLFIRMLG